MGERVIVRCVHGLEWVCAAEVTRRSLGVEPSMDRREIVVSVSSVSELSSLVALRTADDVFVEVGRLDPLRGSADLARLARSVPSAPWRERLGVIAALRPVPSRPMIDVVGSVEGRHNYSRFDLEQAVGSRLAGHLGGRYLVRTAQGVEPGQADLTVRVLARGDGVTVALRVAERPLHRRPYKLDVRAGSLHPPVAASMALLAGPVPGERLLDPFCGDGTIVVEAALVAPGVVVTGSDLDAGRLDGARRNAQRAGVAASFAEADAGEVDGRAGGCVDAGGAGGCVDAVVTNPPWNLAVDAGGRLPGSLEPFWRRLPALLGDRGRVVTITDVGLGVPSVLGELGFPVALATQMRLAGRLCHLTLAGRASLPTDVASWRQRAIALGVATEDGFSDV